MSELKEKINLRDIKCPFIIKQLFLFLSEKQKLDIIIYNKELQKIFGVDIENYKKISGRYKIVKKTGKGKEFDLYTNELKFEGEYLNGKRNGEGKEYNGNGIIIFKGEYLNGKRNGNGEEYYYNGKFVGEYLNGKKMEWERI